MSRVDELSAEKRLLGVWLWRGGGRCYKRKIPEMKLVRLDRTYRNYTSSGELRYFNYQQKLILLFVDFISPCVLAIMVPIIFPNVFKPTTNDPFGIRVKVD